jgi:hypothetical protein
MKIQPLLIGLTTVNLGLLVFLLGKAGVGDAGGAPAVLRGSAIEIVDANGKLRASLTIEPASRRLSARKSRSCCRRNSSASTYRLIVISGIAATSF